MFPSQLQYSTSSMSAAQQEALEAEYASLLADMPQDMLSFHLLQGAPQLSEPTSVTNWHPTPNSGAEAAADLVIGEEEEGGLSKEELRDLFGDAEFDPEVSEPLGTSDMTATPHTAILSNKNGTKSRGTELRTIEYRQPPESHAESTVTADDEKSIDNTSHFKTNYGDPADDLKHCNITPPKSGRTSLGAEQQEPVPAQPIPVPQAPRIAAPLASERSGSESPELVLAKQTRRQRVKRQTVPRPPPSGVEKPKKRRRREGILRARDMVPVMDYQPRPQMPLNTYFHPRLQPQLPNGPVPNARPIHQPLTPYPGPLPATMSPVSLGAGSQPSSTPQAGHHW
ncbi:hypothetical protein F5Y18DRAFT_115287 [Xylariaceae sp. FL1019]|nr:hypothetical protein F5Y18DRAFT_115287 [Xylariaceae sp. FL1019]